MSHQMLLDSGRQPRPERVYVLSSGKHVKIGRTINIKQRIKDLQTSNPETIVLRLLLSTPDAVKLEAWLHKYFASRRLKGEWFNMTHTQAVKEIKELIRKDKIDAFVLTGDEEEPLYHGNCKWCNVGFFSEDKRQQFCDNKNHRIYWSKRRTKELMRFWVFSCEVYSDFRVKEREALLKFERETAEMVAQQLGFIYSDSHKRWVWKDAS